MRSPVTSDNSIIYTTLPRVTNCLRKYSEHSLHGNNNSTDFFARTASICVLHSWVGTEGVNLRFYGFYVSPARSLLVRKFRVAI